MKIEAFSRPDGLPPKEVYEILPRRCLGEEFVFLAKIFLQGAMLPNSFDVVIGRRLLPLLLNLIFLE